MRLLLATLLFCGSLGHAAIITGNVSDAGEVPVGVKVVRFTPSRGGFYGTNYSVDFPRTGAIDTNGNFAVWVAGGKYFATFGAGTRQIAVLVPLNSTNTISFFDAARLAANADLFPTDAITIMVDHTGNTNSGDVTSAVLQGATNAAWTSANTRVTQATNGLWQAVLSIPGGAGGGVTGGELLAATNALWQATSRSLTNVAHHKEDFQFDQGVDYPLALVDPGTGLLYKAPGIVWTETNQAWNIYWPWLVHVGTGQAAEIKVGGIKKMSVSAAGMDVGTGISLGASNGIVSAAGFQGLGGAGYISIPNASSNATITLSGSNGVVRATQFAGEGNSISNVPLTGVAGLVPALGGLTDRVVVLENSPSSSGTATNLTVSMGFTNTADLLTFDIPTNSSVSLTIEVLLNGATNRYAETVTWLVQRGTGAPYIVSTNGVRDYVTSGQLAVSAAANTNAAKAYTDSREVASTNSAKSYAEAYVLSATNSTFRDATNAANTRTTAATNGLWSAVDARVIGATNGSIATSTNIAKTYTDSRTGFGGQYTMATLPASPRIGQTVEWVSDVITSWGTGGTVWFDGTYWRTRIDGVRATADVRTFILRGWEAALNVQTPLSTVWFSKEPQGFSASSSYGLPHLVSFSGGAIGGSVYGDSTDGSFAYLELGAGAPGAISYGPFSGQIPGEFVGVYGNYWVNSLPSGGTNNFWITAGASLGVSTNYPTSGAFFLYDPSNSNGHGLTGMATNNWIAVTGQGSTYTYTDTGRVLGSGNNGNTNQIALVLTTTNCVFYTNGVAAVTHTSNIPNSVLYLDSQRFVRVNGSETRRLFLTSPGVHIRQASPRVY